MADYLQKCSNAVELNSSLNGTSVRNSVHFSSAFSRHSSGNMSITQTQHMWIFELCSQPTNCLPWHCDCRTETEIYTWQFRISFVLHVPQIISYNNAVNMPNNQKFQHGKSMQRIGLLMSQPGKRRFSDIRLYLVKIEDAVALHLSFKLPYRHLKNSRWSLTNQQHKILYNPSFNYNDFTTICFKWNKSFENEIQHNTITQYVNSSQCTTSTLKHQQASQLHK